MREPEFRYLETNGVTLRTVVQGDGPLVILLHGWPQCWFLWRGSRTTFACGSTGCDGAIQGAALFYSRRL